VTVGATAAIALGVVNGKLSKHAEGHPTWQLDETLRRHLLVRGVEILLAIIGPFGTGEVFTLR